MVSCHREVALPLLPVYVRGQRLIAVDRSLPSSRDNLLIKVYSGSGSYSLSLSIPPRTKAMEVMAAPPRAPIRMRALQPPSMDSSPMHLPRRQRPLLISFALIMVYFYLDTKVLSKVSHLLALPLSLLTCRGTYQAVRVGVGSERGGWRLSSEGWSA